jgi:hypothetical protein
MAEFILLLHQSPVKPEGFGPAEMQAAILRYKDWADGVAQKGNMRAGHKLVDGTGRILRGKGEALAVTDGPFADAKEVLGGLFVISAETYEEAVKIAADCPHMDHGMIEVRQIDKV